MISRISSPSFREAPSDYFASPRVSCFTSFRSRDASCISALLSRPPRPHFASPGATSTSFSISGSLRDLVVPVEGPHRGHSASPGVCSQSFCVSGSLLHFSLAIQEPPAPHLCLFWPPGAHLVSPEASWSLSWSVFGPPRKLYALEVPPWRLI